jgi:hexosaminidase
MSTGPNRLHLFRPFLLALFLLPPAVQGQDDPAARAGLDLLPWPSRVELRTGRMPIDGGFYAVLIEYTEPRLEQAVKRLEERIAVRTGTILLPDRNRADRVRARLVVRCTGPGELVQNWRENESYRLTVEAERAILRASTPLGVLRGLETFLQLVRPDGEGFGVPAIDIVDIPRFPWRGLLIDACRHWMPPETIKRNLDGMAAVKLNVLHWHLSEDQGFRVESRLYPKLHELGSDGNYYTQEQIREIVDYARDRGIRVIPEFDMPGHTTAWFVGYPELASGPGPYEIGRTWGVMKPHMDAASKTTYTFLRRFIAEMVDLFPDAYWHIGGDEVPGDQWAENPRIQTFMVDQDLADKHALQAYFNQKLAKILARENRSIVGWDEILHPDLPPGIVIQSWRGMEGLVQAAREGRHAILSNGWYLDHIQPAARHYRVDPLSGPAAALNPQEQAFILGGEACMWSEFVSAETIDSRIWPRTGAIAERLWSAASVTDEEDLYRRLDTLSRDLEEVGLTHLTARRFMLRRLAGDLPVEPLEALSDVLEPVKGYQRPATGSYTSLTPLNRLVDATRPESLTARAFSQTVDRFLADPDGAVADRLFVGVCLAEWQELPSALYPHLQERALLAEAEPLVRALAGLAAVGQEALVALETGIPPEGEDLAALQEVVETARRPQAELLIMVAPAVGRLLNASAGRPPRPRGPAGR